MNLRLKVILACGIVVVMPRLASAACDQTLSLGANVASAISAAAVGTTICLNPGNYGSVNLSSIVKTSDVTLQSASGRTASVGVTLSGSNHLAFRNLTITGLRATGATRNITIADNTFTGQAQFNHGSNGNLNILIDGNTFDGITVCATCFEGRLDIRGSAYPIGITVTNNHFGGPGDSDGIQTGAPGVVIGPGNIFDGLIYLGNRHVDAIQLDGIYGNSVVITGNYFINGGSYIMAPDGGKDEIITNNLFVVGDYVPAVQLGSHANDVITHNTFIGVNLNIDAKTGNTPSSNALARDNILINSTMNLNCTNCTVTHNLFNTSGSAKGTSNILGTPTFVGGPNPSDWAGYQLTSTSLGYRAASDGNDMGTNYFGPEVSGVAPPAVPTGLQVN